MNTPRIDAEVFDGAKVVDSITTLGTPQLHGTITMSMRKYVLERHAYAAAMSKLKWLDPDGHREVLEIADGTRPL